MKSEQQSPQSPHKESDIRQKENTSSYVPQGNNLLSAAFRQVCAEPQLARRASLLVSFVKEFDYRADTQIVETIRSWAQSEDEDLRREAVYSLCVIRPIEDRLSVARQAWPRARAVDAHWYASALTAACDSPDKITLPLVLMVLQRLFTPKLALPESSTTDQDQLHMLDAETDRRWHICAAYSVIVYFHAMLLHGSMNDRVFQSSQDVYTHCLGSGISEPNIDWKCAGEVLVFAATRGDE